MLIRLPVTRTTRKNSVTYSADGTATQSTSLPKFYGKSVEVDNEHKNAKKQGAGKGNWGTEGVEQHDYDYSFTNARRRSNSSGHQLRDFKSKFEVIEDQPVFNVRLHGPVEDEHDIAENTSISDDSLVDEEAATAHTTAKTEAGPEVKGEKK